MSNGIKEGDIVQYISHDGYRVRGRVILLYTSTSGEQCVSIDNFATNRLLSEVVL